ncbi:hypothetical protein A5730_02645 [Mycobacterium sp. ACS4054]|nr:hypothetical protein A5730_02645 [Mycobacterium sp. ACS4054]
MLFFQYDGSQFYMSRDGVEQEYLDCAVPGELEASWRRELTAAKLARLDQPGNWSTLDYLHHHNDTRYLHLVERTEPLGKFWERFAYLESLLKYTQQCAASYRIDEIRNAIRMALAKAEELGARGAPDEELRDRVQQLIETARRMLAQQEQR